MSVIKIEKLFMLMLSTTHLPKNFTLIKWNKETKQQQKTVERMKREVKKRRKKKKTEWYKKY